MHLNRIVGIQNYGPSGTLLIQSLLDNHPHTLSLPALHGQYLYKFWQKHNALNPEELLYNFMEKHAHWFSLEEEDDVYGLLQLGKEWNESAVIDKEIFEKHLRVYWKHCKELTRRDFIISIYIAYNQTLGRHIHDDSVVVFPVHSSPPQYIEQLIEDFDQIKMLHMVRNPIQSIGSHAKHIANHPNLSKRILLECCVSQMLLDEMRHFGRLKVHGMEPYFPDSHDRFESKAVRLEDIHNKPKETMNAVADWIGISWDDVLLESTFNGKLWHNRRESIRQSGIGQQTIQQQHTNYLTEFDKKRLRILANDHCSAFGYDIINEKDNDLSIMELLMPFKMEYILSRFVQRIRYYLRPAKKLQRYNIPSIIIYCVMILLLPIALFYSVVTGIAGYTRSRTLLMKALKNHRQGMAYNFVPLLPM